MNLGLDSKLSLGESSSSLEVLSSLLLGLGSGKSSSDSSGLLSSKILRSVLLLLVELTELLTLSVVDDGQDAGNGLSSFVQLGRLDVAARSVLDTKLGKLLLESKEFVLELLLGFVAVVSSLRVGLFTKKYC